MMKKLFLLLLSFFGCMTSGMHAQQPSDNTSSNSDYTRRMQWFADAKLGIFIHWGIYAVDGTSESWAFYNEQVPYEVYMGQAKRFTASHYNPKEWVDLIKESGARYTVLTTKHHDGVALWDTKAGKLSTRKSTPAKRDLITPFVNEVRSQGLKLGLYYSLLDWSHKDYPNFTKNIVRYKDDEKRWNRFVDFNFAQLTELNSQYKPDLYWFDGDWEQSAERWHAADIIKLLRSTNPDCVVNSRIQGYGDYATPELGVPVKRPEAPYWELCLTMNDSWGWQPTDTNFKTPYMLLRTFVDCLSNGGNLLLDIGPREDGSIPEEEVNILKEFGRWTKKHAEAIYGTRRGIDNRCFQGYTALNKDGNTLYLYIPYTPHDVVEVKGLLSDVKRVRVVGSNRELNFKLYNKPSWASWPGNLYIEVPEDVLDKQITVIAVDFNEPLKTSLDEQ